MLANYIDANLQPNNLSADINSHRAAYEHTYDHESDSAKIPANIFALIGYSDGQYQINMQSNRYTGNNANTISVKEMVEKIRSIFGLNAIQVASLVGVSRPSLYNHISIKENPKDLNAYIIMYDLAIRVEAEIPGDLKPGLKTVLVQGKTLLQYLKQKPIDLDQIVVIARQVYKKISSSDKAAPNLTITEQRIKSRNLTKSG